MVHNYREVKSTFHTLLLIGNSTIVSPYNNFFISFLNKSCFKFIFVNKKSISTAAYQRNCGYCGNDGFILEFCVRWKNVLAKFCTKLTVIKLYYTAEKKVNALLITIQII